MTRPPRAVLDFLAACTADELAAVVTAARNIPERKEPTLKPNPAESAARLAAGIDEALAAHGVPPRPERKRDTDDRGARFAAQARRARETAAEYIDPDRISHRNRT